MCWMKANNAPVGINNRVEGYDIMPISSYYYTPTVWYSFYTPALLHLYLYVQNELILTHFEAIPYTFLHAK